MDKKFKQQIPLKSHDEKDHFTHHIAYMDRLSTILYRIQTHQDLAECLDVPKFLKGELRANQPTEREMRFGVKTLSNYTIYTVGKKL